MRRDGKPVETIDDLAGLARTNLRLRGRCRHADVLAWRAFRRWPGSSPSSTCSWRRSRPACCPLAVIGVLASVVGASTTCASSRSCISTNRRRRWTASRGMGSTAIMAGCRGARRRWSSAGGAVAAGHARRTRPPRRCFLDRSGRPRLSPLPRLRRARIPPTSEARRRPKRASAVRSGSWPTARPRAAAAAAAPGRRAAAICAATLLLRPQGASAAAATVASPPALAVADLAARFRAACGASRVKWPNDVLADGTQAGRHPAGIRTGCAGATGWPSASASTSPPRPKAPNCPPPPCRSAASRRRRRDEALTLLAALRRTGMHVWLSGGFAPLRTAWLARAGGLGTSHPARGCRDETVDGAVRGHRRHDGALLLNEQGRITRDLRPARCLC